MRKNLGKKTGMALAFALMLTAAAGCGKKDTDVQTQAQKEQSDNGTGKEKESGSETENQNQGADADQNDSDSNRPETAGQDSSGGAASSADSQNASNGDSAAGQNASETNSDKAASDQGSQSSGSDASNDDPLEETEPSGVAEAQPEAPKEAPVSTNSKGALTYEEAEQLLTEKIGSEDAETGNTYSYGYADTCTIDGEDYYIFVWSWLVEDHMSRITDLAVKSDGSAAYEAMYDGESVEILSDKNLLAS